jgi:GNAT superfamily N-acetyltransferase
MIRKLAENESYADVYKAFELDSKEITVDVEYARETYRKLMKSGAMTVLIAIEDEVQGGLAFIVHPDLHNGILTAVETFWYVRPEYRKSRIASNLFDAFEEEAKQQKCKRVAVVHMVDSYPEILERFYISKGYHLLEKHYIKEL